MNPVIYVFVNKSLGMSAGKVAAQAAHAVAMVMINEPQITRNFWKESMHRTMLIMEGRNEAHMLNIERYLNERKIVTRLIVEEGVNEIDSHTITALATGILDKEVEDTVKAMSTFKLYRDVIRINMEVDR